MILDIAAGLAPRAAVRIERASEPRADGRRAAAVGHIGAQTPGLGRWGGRAEGSARPREPPGPAAARSLR